MHQAGATPRATPDLTASLDLGTNTFRLLIGEEQGGRMRPKLVRNIITRLGENLTDSGPLYTAATERALSALSEFRRLMDAHGVMRHRAVGTSALRRASDAAAFTARVHELTGIRIEVIPGDEEARLTAAGMLWAVGERGKRVVVFDIGGGSTEFILMEAGRLVSAKSLEMGVVRLTESFLRHDPPQGAELARVRAAVAAVMAQVEDMARAAFGEVRTDALVATAGTPTTIAAMELGLSEYDPARVNGYVLRRGPLEELLARLAAMPAAERLGLPGLVSGREDLILPGICIVLGAMLSFRASEVVVSDGGLLEGVLLDLFQNPAKGADLAPTQALPRVTIRSHE